jgi:hypothetical protein
MKNAVFCDIQIKFIPHRKHKEASSGCIKTGMCFTASNFCTESDIWLEALPSCRNLCPQPLVAPLPPKCIAPPLKLFYVELASETLCRRYELTVIKNRQRKKLQAPVDCPSCILFKFLATFSSALANVERRCNVEMSLQGARSKKKKKKMKFCDTIHCLPLHIS